MKDEFPELLRRVEDAFNKAMDRVCQLENENAELRHEVARLKLARMMKPARGSK
jgi:hypothetical protein